MALGTTGLLFRIKGDASQARSEMSKFAKDSKLAFHEVEESSNKAGSSFRDSFLGNVAAGAVQELTSSLLQGAKAVFAYSVSLEQTKIGFTTLLGSAAAAEKHLADLQKFAQATPFEFASLTVASRRLQNVGIEAAKVIPVMKDIGNAAAAAGASSAELDSISLAFSQIVAKGKVSAEEVNQLAERGIPVWRLLSEELGKSKEQVIKLAEQGKISSDVFLEAFHRFSEANFGGAMEAQSKTFQGAMSTIKDVTLNAASEGFKPLYDWIVRYGNRLAKNEAEIQSWGKTTQKVLQDVIDGLSAANDPKVSGDDSVFGAAKKGLDAFDWYLRNLAPLTKAFSDWGEAMRVAGAQLRNLENGMLNLQTFTLQVPGQQTTTPSVTDATGQPPLAVPESPEKVNKIKVQRADVQKEATADQIAFYEKQSALFQEQLRREFDLWDAQQKTILARMKADLAIGAVFEDDFAKKRQQYDREVLEGKLANLEIERNKRKEFGLSIVAIENDIKIAREAIDREAQEQREEAAIKESEARKARYAAELEALRTTTLETIDVLQSSVQTGDFGGVEGGIFGAWTASWKEFVDAMDEDVGTVQDSLSTMAEILQQAFEGVAQALGNVVQQWVLYGTTGPAVMRKVLASALATIAAEAAVQAIYATALGFLRLAQHDYGAAGEAFASAAGFAVLAGVAALAGRAIAGDAFKQQTAGGGAGAGASGSGGRSRAENNTAGQGGAYSSYGDKAYIQEESRNAPGVAVQISFKDKPDWFNEMFETSWKANGKVRRLVEDGR